MPCVRRRPVCCCERVGTAAFVLASIRWLLTTAALTAVLSAGCLSIYEFALPSDARWWVQLCVCVRGHRRNTLLPVAIAASDSRSHRRSTSVPKRLSASMVAPLALPSMPDAQWHTTSREVRRARTHTYTHTRQGVFVLIANKLLVSPIRPSHAVSIM
jgi:hypothetical protein